MTKVIARKRISAALIALSLFASPMSRAAGVASTLPLPSGVYAGTIGGAPVIAQFGGWLNDDTVRAHDGKIEGVVFYQSHAVGIGLVASIDRDGIVVREDAPGGNAPKKPIAVWHVASTPNALRGTFDLGTGARLTPIALSRIGDATQPSNPEAEYAALVYARLLTPPSRSATHTIAGGIAYQTLRDARLGMSTVTFTRLASQQVLVTADRALATDFDRRRIVAIDCLTSGRASAGGFGEYAEKMKVAYLSSKALSLDIRVEDFCGGPHPEAFVSPVTVDLRDGSIVAFDRAILDARGIAKRYAAGALARAKRSDPDCVGPDASEVFAYVYEFVPAGLLVHGSLSHVDQDCEADVVIPSVSAAPLLRPSFRALLP